MQTLPTPARTRPASKPWWQSKTIWFNLFTAVLIATELQLGVLKTAMPDWAYAWAGFALAMANVVLRTISSAALSARPEPGAEAESVDTPDYP